MSSQAGSCAWWQPAPVTSMEPPAAHGGYAYVYVYVSLSLSIYIYIYIPHKSYYYFSTLYIIIVLILIFIIIGIIVNGGSISCRRMADPVSRRQRGHQLIILIIIDIIHNNTIND